jgi:hypothetical protein
MKMEERHTPEFRARVNSHYSCTLDRIREERRTAADPAHVEACNMLLKFIEGSWFEVG